MKKKKKKSSGSSGGGAQQFLLLHGEKIAVGVVIVVALWFAVQGLGYQTLTWQPSALEEDASAAETAIRNSTRTAEDEGIEFFDHAAFAEQIKAPISGTPYRNPASALWNPSPVPVQTGAQSQSQSYSY
ncbi:MAG: hypothetical protein FWE95_08485 [Planctomycetaceae bacterium]|nr:hypothetical protein [Planctomycetaceae bacterium]